MSYFSQDVTYINTPVGSNLIGELSLHFLRHDLPTTIITNDQQQSLILSQLNNSRLITYTTILLSFNLEHIDPVVIIESSKINNTLLDLFIAKWKQASERTTNALPDAKAPSGAGIALFKKKLIVINKSPPEVNSMILEKNNAPVEIYYHTRNYTPNNPNLFPDLIQVLNNFTTSASSLVNEGHMLIFVATPADIETLTTLVQELNHESYDVVGLNSTDGVEALYTNKRKIIITTENLSELLILDKLGAINGVIDTMFTLDIKLTGSGGIRNKTRYISKNSAIAHQRWTGQSAEGFCYRLCTRELYESLPLNNPNNISKNKILLELISTGTLTPSHIDANLLPTLDSLRNLELIQLENNVYSLTPAGSFVLAFPFSLRNSLALYYVIQQANPIFPALCVLSMADSTGPYFIYPKRDPGISQQEYTLVVQEHTERFFKAFIGDSDLHTLSNIWVAFLNEAGGLHIDSLKSWSRLHSLNYVKLLEVFNIINSSLSLLGTKVTVGPFDTMTTINNLRPILAKVYADEIVQRQDMVIDRPLYINPKTSKTYYLENFSGLFLNPPPYIIPLLTTEVVSYGSLTPYITIALDYDSSNLASAASAASLLITSRPTDISEPSLPDPSVANTINAPVSAKVMGPLLYLKEHQKSTPNDSLFFD